jgi:hypothetical protein
MLFIPSNIVKSDRVIDFILGHFHFGSFSFGYFDDDFICFIKVDKVDIMPEGYDFIPIGDIDSVFEALFLVRIGLEAAG